MIHNDGTHYDDDEGLDGIQEIYSSNLLESVKDCKGSIQRKKKQHAATVPLGILWATHRRSVERQRKCNCRNPADGAGHDGEVRFDAR